MLKTEGMMELKVQFLQRVQRTPNVCSFRFINDSRLDFISGQFGQLIFNPADRADKQLNKYLSFSCAPGKQYLEFTKKISTSGFSQRLMALKEGAAILLKAPLGHCTLNGDEKKIAFLVGGIGITPAISIIEHLAEKRIVLDACLLYSNWTSADIAFRKELDEWSHANPNIRVIHTLIEKKPEDVNCYSGMITKEFITQQMSDYKDRIIFIFGPPAMVKAMQDLCMGLDCQKEMIRAENFAGYS